MPMRPGRKKDIALLSAFVSTLVLCLFFFAAGFRTSSAKQQKGSLKNHLALDDLPITNYEPSEPRSGMSPSVRRERNSRYDNRGGIKEDPNVSLVATSAHWGTQLAPLPVVQSDEIVLGKVIDAEAHLSTDRTGIYSEFTLEVEDTYKRRNSGPIYPGAKIAVIREGGAVKFASGHIQGYIVAHQNMPRIGARYLLFLKQGQDSESFDIVTGYQLRDHKVTPLDSLEIFAGYNGVSETDFLDAVRDVINHATQ